jgi:hypothetical protein
MEFLVFAVFGTCLLALGAMIFSALHGDDDH